MSKARDIADLDFNSVDLDGGTIDGATISTSDITITSGKTLDVSAGTLTLANNQISGDKIEGGTVAAMTITSLSGTLQTAAQPNITSLGPVAFTGEITANGGIALGDGDELTLGDSDEFKIKHHASGYTHLQNTVGTLYIDSDSVTFRDDDGSPSNMVISQTGIDVTGTVTGGNGTFSNLTIDATEKLRFDGSGGHTFIQESSNDTLTFATGGSTRLTLNSNATFSGSVTSTGLTAKVAQTANTVMEVAKITTSGSYSSTGSVNAGGALTFGQYDDSYPDWNLSQIASVRNGSGWNGDLVFYTNNGVGQTSIYERMRLSSLGNLNLVNGGLMIGATTAPSAPLQVSAAPSNTVGAVGISLKDSGNAIEFGLRLDATSKDLHLDRYYNGGWLETMSWDRSTGNVGIGSSNPTSNLGWNRFLEIAGGSSNAVIIDGTDGQQANVGSIDGMYIDVYGHSTATNNNIIFRTQNANGVSSGIERMRIDSSGNVEVKGGNELRVYRGDNATYGSMKYLTGSGGLQFNDQNSDGISFVRAGSTESMRIDSSGNVLVGLTSTSGIATGSTADNGVYVDGSVGAIVAQSSANKNLYCSKASGYSDPDFISFQVNGTTVGSIGTTAGNLWVAGATNGIRLAGGTFNATNASGTVANGAVDLGYSNGKWKDLYLSGYASVNALASPDGTSIVYPANTGYVGVGTGSTAPATRLHVLGNSNLAASLTLHNTAPSTDNIWRITPFYNSGDLGFLDGDTERMRLSSSNLEFQSGANASTIIRSTLTTADGYRAGFEASNAHTGGSVWSMFSTNVSDGYFGAGKFCIANETMGAVDADTVAKFVIDGTGKVGIGTIAPPHQKLTVTGVSAAVDGVLANGILALTTGTGAITDTRLLFGIVDDSYAWLQAADYGVAYRNVAINPNGGSLFVGDNSVASGSNSTCTISDGGTILTSRAATNTQYHHQFYNPNGQVGNINTTGSSTNYAVSSDYRLKENVVPMTGSIDRVKALKPSRFNFIVDADRTVDGFLAHEAQTVVPECVTGTKDAMMDEEYEVTAAVYEDVTTPAVEAVDAVVDEDGVVITEAVEAVAETTESVLVTEAVMGTRSVPDMQGIDQAKLVPLLTAALQEAITKIESLTDRIAALEE